MAVQKLSSMINPNACSPAQIQRNMQNLFQIMQLIDNVLEISVDETTNEITYNLVNLTTVTMVTLNVTNVTVSNTLTSTTINVTTINSQTINTAYITSWIVTYYNLYNNTTYVCPPPCGSGSSGSGSGSSGSCTTCEKIDLLDDVINITVEWPIGSTPTSINLTRYDPQVLSSTGAGYCQKRYQGSGAFGDGNGMCQFKVWVYRSCTPGSSTEVYLTHDACSGGTYLGSAEDKTTWIQATSDDDDPLYGEVDGSASGLGACGAHPGAYHIVISNP